MKIFWSFNNITALGDKSLILVLSFKGFSPWKSGLPCWEAWEHSKHVTCYLLRTGYSKLPQLYGESGTTRQIMPYLCGKIWRIYRFRRVIHSKNEWRNSTITQKLKIGKKTNELKNPFQNIAHLLEQFLFFSIKWLKKINLRFFF